jgi:hypothetical protein
MNEYFGATMGRSDEAKAPIFVPTAESAGGGHREA